ncbi:magnesium transporter CorA family protein [Paenibacillus sp. UNC451MF]|uniref:magnesium transporter CorA family protein n=1 Tax=Paenibacillus sp. UNC451MF TaxID=1449063 RepID=UPI00068FFA28|nr:magnesium transporter CorA family protein [Paenibacillus sp. UNC451MF]
MAIRQIHMPEGWTWHVGNDWVSKQNEEINTGLPHSRHGSAWKNHFGDICIQTPRMFERDNGLKAIYGSLLYGSLMNQREDGDRHLLYCVDEQDLFTSELYYSSMSDLDEDELVQRMQGCRTAAEGFFVLLGEMALVCLHGLDVLTADLTKLERSMRKFNNSVLLDHLIERQYDLLYWRHRIVPLEELLVAVKEAYTSDQLDHNEAYRLTSLRVERLMLRMERFHDEVRTLLAMDENIASYRGNEIMKTLTVFTVVCTPATLFAGLWGMNFKAMPELEYEWGYPMSIAIIVFLTILVYAWLKWKGWTGDLIRGKRKDSNIF